MDGSSTFYKMTIGLLHCWTVHCVLTLMGGVGAVVAPKIIVSAPVPFGFIGVGTGLDWDGIGSVRIGDLSLTKICIF